MIQAAACGAIDFRASDPLDSKWWKQLRLVLDHLERVGLAEHYKLHYGYGLAALARDNLTDESYRKIAELTEANLVRITGLLRPWERADPEEAKAAKVDHLAQAWKQIYGDPSDPAVQARIDATVRSLQKADVGHRAKRAP
jgi:hypothetical protein